MRTIKKPLDGTVTVDFEIKLMVKPVAEANWPLI